LPGTFLRLPERFGHSIITISLICCLPPVSQFFARR
jgi:hypothetical protein